MAYEFCVVIDIDWIRENVKVSVGFQGKWID